MVFSKDKFSVFAGWVLFSSLMFAPSHAVFALQADADLDRQLVDFDKQCRNGDLGKCNALSIAYSTGLFMGKNQVKENQKRAKGYVDFVEQRGKSSCAGRGPVDDCYFYADLFFDNPIMPTDHVKGVSLMERACKNGSKPACVWMEESGYRF